VFGLRGEETIGHDLKATFNLEAHLDPGTGQTGLNALWARGANVGLAGSWGRGETGAANRACTDRLSDRRSRGHPRIAFRHSAVGAQFATEPRRPVCVRRDAGELQRQPRDVGGRQLYRSTDRRGTHSD
jgi:hypothetical protein